MEQYIAGFPRTVMLSERSKSVILSKRSASKYPLRMFFGFSKTA